MNSSRNINASLFVTILSACFGLVVAGAPVHAFAHHLATTTDASQSAKEKIEDSSSSKIEHTSPKQARKLAATHNSHFAPGHHCEHDQPDLILYQNTKALIDNNRVLIVTHLPRAALSERLAKKPAAN